MKPEERPQFAERLTAAMLILGEPVTEILLDLYWAALEPYPLDDVARGLSAYCRNPDSGQFKPKPADIIRQIEGDTESQGLAAWTQVLATIRRHGSYTTVRFYDPIVHVVIEEMGGWVHVAGTLLEDQAQFIARDFVKRYRAHAVQGRIPQYPPKLVGRTEVANRMAGYLEDANATKVVQVGFPKDQAMIELKTARKNQALLEGPADEE